MHLKMSPVKWRPFCPWEMSYKTNEIQSNPAMPNTFVQNILVIVCWFYQNCFVNTECHSIDSWWRHQMKTFPRYWPLPVTGEFHLQRSVARSFDTIFDLRLNKRLSKQSICWWFGTPSRSLWRHCKATLTLWGSITYSIQAPVIMTSYLPILIPDSKARWAHVDPTWSRQDPRWANVGLSGICWTNKLRKEKSICY